MTFSSTKLYNIDAIRQLEHIAIQDYKIAGYELMIRAGTVTFDYLQRNYPLAKKILICCGAGNNAGDGYVIAKLAMLAGLEVSVISLIDVKKLSGDAQTAYQDWHAMGHQLVKVSDDLIQQSDVIIDALLGTGLQRELQADWLDLVDAINASHSNVISVDVPSGLCADTGRVLGSAIQATATITYIGLKKGLFTHKSVDYCGEIILDDLNLPSALFKRQASQAQLLDWSILKNQLTSRNPSSHKHQCGHVLIIGGDIGMPGAVRLTAEAALRAGAGLVTVVSHAEHQDVLLSGRPEIMMFATESGQIPVGLLSKADVIVIGPGLTDSLWSKKLLAAVLNSATPKIIDAGALRLLEDEQIKGPCVLTPHAGEAAALLGETAEDIQESRFTSADLLQQKYAAHIILKGAGSIVQSDDELPQVCPYGNAGMATAGMGDVLSGLLGALFAQGYPPVMACRLAVCIHSLAADKAAQAGQIGLLSSDLFPHIRQLMN